MTPIPYNVFYYDRSAGTLIASVEHLIYRLNLGGFRGLNDGKYTIMVKGVNSNRLFIKNDAHPQSLYGTYYNAEHNLTVVLEE